MQKLSREFKNTPRDASQVPCSVNSDLNREGASFLSDQGKVLTDNNLDVNLSLCTGRLKVVVYVQGINGKLLVPCKIRKEKQFLPPLKPVGFLAENS